MNISRMTETFVTDLIERERKVVTGLVAMKEITTEQVAAHLIAAFGVEGAQNIARCLINQLSLYE